MSTSPRGSVTFTTDPPRLRPIDDREVALRAVLQTINRRHRTTARVHALASEIHRSCYAALASLEFDQAVKAATGGKRVRHKVDPLRSAAAKASKHAMQDRLIVGMPRAVTANDDPAVRENGFQGGATREPVSVVEAALARWRRHMSAQGHAPEPEPGNHPGRTPSSERLFLVEDIGRAYTRLSGRRPGRIETGRPKREPSPFERFAMAVLGIYGLPDTYGEPDSWITGARTREVQDRRKACREILPRAN